MKATVGFIFKALQLENGERNRQLRDSAENQKPMENYGRLLILHSLLAEVLENCQVEIELPQEIAEFLVPFLMDSKSKI